MTPENGEMKTCPDHVAFGKCVSTISLMLFFNDSFFLILRDGAVVGPVFFSSQVQEVLVENSLRERVTLRVDGGIKTGWESWPQGEYT